jgi:Flp pilus assembly protein TadD
MMPEWKERLEQRLSSHPFLLMLLVETRFRLVFLGVGLVLLFILISLPKIWRTTPDGFLPVVRVSLLDFAQARSLRRSAEEAAALGKWDQAQRCWEAASANNPGDIALARGCLRQFVQGPARPELLDRAARSAFWLLRLGATNDADLVLTGQALAHLGTPDDLIGLLASQAGALPLELETLLAQAQLETGQNARFAAAWREVRKRFPNAGKSGRSRVLDLAWAAREEGDPGKAAALGELQALAAGSSVATEASRALLALAFESRDAALGEHTIQHWPATPPPELRDFVTYWRLLSAAGRTQLAQSLATAWDRPPNHPRELMLLVKGRMEVGARDAALKALREGVDRVGASPEIWLAYGMLLLDLRRWDDLRALAVRIRVQGGGAGLEGFAHYVEGRSEIGLGQFDNAARSFAKAASAAYSSPKLAQAVATELIKIQYPGEAITILRGVQDRLKLEPAFWIVLFEAADLRKDVSLMREAIEKAYALAPDDPIVLNNYAATLLIQREQPELAAKLTLSLLARYSAAVEPQVNHAMALLMNRRADEAGEILGRVNAAQLNPPQASLYHLVLFEIESQRGRIQEARRAAAIIHADHLYPPQRAWLSNALQRLAAPGVGPESRD